MLIEKKPVGPVVNDTISFRLISGEEILGKLTAEDDNSITVSKPVVVQMQMLSPTQAGLGFAPFMATSDEETTKFRIDKAKLVCDPIKPRDDIRQQYVKMTTGLDVPSTPTLIKP